MELMFNKQCSVVADVDVGLIKLLSLIEACRVLRTTNPTRKLSLSVAWKINGAHTLPFIARHGVYPLACFYQLEPSTLQLLGIDNDLLIWIRKIIGFLACPKRLTFGRILPVDSSVVTSGGHPIEATCLMGWTCGGDPGVIFHVE